MQLWRKKGEERERGKSRAPFCNNMNASEFTERISQITRQSQETPIIISFRLFPERIPAHLRLAFATWNDASKSDCIKN